MAQSPYLSEETILAAALSFSLELELRKRKTHPKRGREKKVVPVLDDFQTILNPVTEEILQEEVVMEEADSEYVPSLRHEMEPRRMSSRLFRKTLPNLMSQPGVANDRSEEENPPVDRRQRRNKTAAAAKARESRKSHKQIKESIKSTMRVSGVAIDVRNNASLTKQWRQMRDTATEFLSKLSRRANFRKATFHAFFLNSVNSLKSTMSVARARPPEVHTLIIDFVVDLNKIYNIAYTQGMKEVVETLPRLVEGILGKYLSSQKIMHPTHMPWVQTREVLTMLMSVLYKADSIYGILQCLSRTQIYFINKWAALEDRDEEFIAYAISQLQIFSSTLSRRLDTLVKRDKYGYTI